MTLFQHAQTRSSELLSGCIYFWSHVVWSATERICSTIEIDLQFAHAEIGNAHVAFVIQQDIVQL